MIPRELGPQIGFKKRPADLVNTGNRDRLDHDMRRHDDETRRTVLKKRGVDQGD